MKIKNFSLKFLIWFLILLLFLITFIIFFLLDKKSKIDISKIDWRNIHTDQCEIADYLITSKVFLGFDTARVKKILGEPNEKISLNNKWVYNISYCNQDISLVFHWLTIHFDNKYHVSVVEHESRQD